MSEQSASSASGAVYIYGPGGLPVEQIAGSTTLYLHHDQLGSTRLVTDSAGATGTATTATYDPYGNQTSSSGSLTTNLMFGGQYLDTESGLYYLRARYYDAATGQFLTRDPQTAHTRSPYAYAVGNPVSAVDPSGLDPWGTSAAVAAQPSDCGISEESLLSTSQQPSYPQVKTIGDHPFVILGPGQVWDPVFHTMLPPGIAALPIGYFDGHYVFLTGDVAPDGAPEGTDIDTHAIIAAESRDHMAVLAGAGEGFVGCLPFTPAAMGTGRIAESTVAGAAARAGVLAGLVTPFYCGVAGAAIARGTG